MATAVRYFGKGESVHILELDPERIAKSRRITQCVTADDLEDP
jgi:hypothetical protein